VTCLVLRYFVERGDGRVRVDRVRHDIGEGLAGELINDVQDLDRAAGLGDVEQSSAHT